LPRLSTDFEHPEPSIRRSGSRRDREKPLIYQEPQDRPSSRDRSSPKPPPDGAFLSPAAVKLTAGGRDRAYSDVKSDTSAKSGRSPSTRRNADIEVSDRKKSQRSSRFPETSPHHRRALSSTNMPIRDGPPADKPMAYIQPSGGDPEDIMAYMAPDDSFMTGKGDAGSPARKPRSGDSPPPHPRGAREMPGASPTRRRNTRAAAQDRDGYSSDDSYKGRRSNRAERSYPTRTPLDQDQASVLSPGRKER
jgi:hypothetical protein